MVNLVMSRNCLNILHHMVMTYLDKTEIKDFEDRQAYRHYKRKGEMIEIDLLRAVEISEGVRPDETATFTMSEVRGRPPIEAII